MAQQMTVSGGFVQIYSQGVWISGESAIGKSELLLELLDRGHKIIADDVITFQVDNFDINGFCPDDLKNLIHIRGLGLINLMSVGGKHAIIPQARLDVVVQLELWQPPKWQTTGDLSLNKGQRQMLGLSIPEYVLPVSPGRHLALLVEIIIKNHLQL